MTNTPENIAAAVQQLAAAGACGYSLLTGQPCPIHDNGVPARATITVKPQPADPKLMTIEVDSQGIPPAAVAYALRQAAEQLEKQARADTVLAVPTVGDRYVKRHVPDIGRVVTVNRVWQAEDGHTAVAYEWSDSRPGQCGSACPLDVFHRTYEPEQAADPVAEAVGRVLAEWPEHNTVGEHQAVTWQVTDAVRRALANQNTAKR
ncbi:hypothetical protein AB0D33_38125 [Streptomyces sp. NPDC048404]|uniref:hypothetical protein n=1 Tax=unclassified Streptomyces TaxID=2593676 RepID=UPI003419AC24